MRFLTQDTLPQASVWRTVVHSSMCLAPRGVTNAMSMALNGGSYEHSKGISYTSVSTIGRCYGIEQLSNKIRRRLNLDAEKLGFPLEARRMFQHLSFAQRSSEHYYCTVPCYYMTAGCINLLLTGLLNSAGWTIQAWWLLPKAMMALEFSKNSKNPWQSSI